jgi:lysophospholipase L1-like esterase
MKRGTFVLALSLALALPAVAAAQDPSWTLIRPNATSDNHWRVKPHPKALHSVLDEPIYHDRRPVLAADRASATHPKQRFSVRFSDVPATASAFAGGQVWIYISIRKHTRVDVALRTRRAGRLVLVSSRKRLTPPISIEPEKPPVGRNGFRGWLPVDLPALTAAEADRLSLAVRISPSAPGRSLSRVYAAFAELYPDRGTYVALGDSVAALQRSYVDLLFGALQTAGAVDTLYNRARGGEDSTSLRANGQLTRAIADIDRPSDTKVVTIDIGGNDRGRCGGSPPTWHLPTCPFAGNFDASLADLQAALDRDPGKESLAAMTYYNPATGTGTAQEQVYDDGLLGTDHQLACAPAGDSRLGLNDQIACISSRRGALVADVYPAFKLGGQAFISDGLHPSSEGQAAIARQFGQVLGSTAPSRAPAASQASAATSDARRTRWRGARPQAGSGLRGRLLLRAAPPPPRPRAGGGGLLRRARRGVGHHHEVHAEAVAALALCRP